MMKVYFSLAGGLFVLLLFQNAYAVNLSGKIEDFQLFNCGAKYCFSIKSDVAYLSKYAGNYAFDSAQITIVDNLTHSSKTFNSKDAFYDVLARKVIMRSIVHEEKSDFVFDVEGQKLIKYKRF